MWAVIYTENNGVLACDVFAPKDEDKAFAHFDSLKESGYKTARMVWASNLSEI